MSTRGLVGIRNNSKLVTTRYHSSDSYYDSCGREALDIYFDYFDKKINIEDGILRLAGNEDGEDNGFLQDGLFCEFAYIYNCENDTLEVYRGFFHKRQAFDTKNQIINSLEEQTNGKEKWFCHLVLIIDRKKHTKKKVLKAFEEYNTRPEIDDEGELPPYPEQRIIPLKIPENYVLIV